MKASTLIKIIELDPDAEILIKHYTDNNPVGSVEIAVQGDIVSFIMKSKKTA